MEDDAKRAVVPRLRFPEYRRAAGWDEMSIGSVCDLKAGEFVPASEITESPQDGLFPCYGGNGLRGYVKSSTHNGRYILVGRQGALCGNVNLFAGKFHATEHALVVTARPEIDTDWLFYALALLKLNRFSIGQAQPGLSVGVLNRLCLAVPVQKAEQKKIADCLMSLDEVIAAQGRKVEAMRAHKKGLMQQLFPREGETVPRLRFPEFRDAGEWEAQRIVDLKPFITSGSRGWAAYYSNSGSLFVRITNLSRESICLDLTDKKFVNLPPDATEGVRTQLKIDDVLISVTADIGMIGHVDADIPSPAYINQHIALVRFDPAAVHGKFVAYFLASDESQNRFRAATDSGTKAGMNLTSVQNMPLLLPLPAEQQQIADCLSSLDAEIVAESDKLAALKTHKKGLMQQLFPSPEGD